MNPTHALAPVRPRLASVLTLLLLAAAASVQATPRCDELRDSLLAEPEWYSQECLVNPNSLEIAEPRAKAGSDTAYAQDLSPFSDNFVNHALSDFPGQAVVGASALEINGYDFDPTATTLYALTHQTRQLGTVNLGNGTFNAIGSSVPLAGHVWTGLAIDPGSGTFYASSSNLTSSSLYTLNPATGAATLIGTDASVDAIIDIAVSCDGEIYGHDIVSDSIFQINPATGLATLVGPTGVDSNFSQGMDFDNDSGILYAWTYQGVGENQYGTINLATGQLTPLSVNDPLGEFEGATQTTCDGTPPPPAPIFSDGFESGNTSRWSSTQQ